MKIQEVCVKAFAPDGFTITVSARRGVPGLAAFKGPFREAMHGAVELARLCEPVSGTMPVVLLESQITPSPPQPHLLAAHTRTALIALLEGAAVLADRAARGLLKLPPAGAVFMGQCPDWTSGVLQPLPPDCAPACLAALLQQPDLGEVLVVMPAPALSDKDAPCGDQDEDPHVHQVRQSHPRATVQCADDLLHFSGSLSGLRRPLTAEVLFPAVGSQGLQALWPIRVSVSPARVAVDEPIIVAGVADPRIQARAKGLLQALRRLESGSAPPWQTVVTLPAQSFDGGSFELALVMADRMSRGREWRGPGRVMATGRVDAEVDPGQVMDVVNTLESQPPGAATASAPGSSKLDILACEARPGDTVLLPAAWRGLPLPKQLKPWRALPEPDTLAQVVYVDHVQSRGV